MGRKKLKKNQKASSSSVKPQQTEDKKNCAGTEESDDDIIEKDDDLYISDNDVNLISNFIRTTNKSFHSLGNTVVETFANRCALGISYALMSLYEESSDEKDDAIRRLNIIYIIWRLPEIEHFLRTKPQKNMNDIYTHMFSSFLFFVEKQGAEIESSLARIIVNNKVANVEKLTASDFWSKAKGMKIDDVDYDAHDKWEAENTSHWPRKLNDDIPVSFLMRYSGMDRKDFEFGIQEAFYPIFHPPPTLPPSRVHYHEEELKGQDIYPLLSKYGPTKENGSFDSATNETQTVLEPKTVDIRSILDTNEKASKEKDGFYPATNETQKKVLEAFLNFRPQVEEFQKDIYSRMAPNDVADAKLIIKKFEKSEYSSQGSAEDDSDSFDDEEEEMADDMEPTQIEILEYSERTVIECVDNIINGVQLGVTKTNIMVNFLGNCSASNKEYIRVMAEAKNDDKLVLFIKQNSRPTAEIMIRTIQEDGIVAFRRYITIMRGLEFCVPQIEIILRLGKEIVDRKLINAEYREELYKYLEHFYKYCEQSQNHHAVRLVSLLHMLLISEKVILTEGVIEYLKPFLLQFSENSGATDLYATLTKLRSEKELAVTDQPGPSAT